MQPKKTIYLLSIVLILSVASGSFLLGLGYNRGLCIDNKNLQTSTPDGKSYRNTYIVQVAKNVSPCVVGIINYKGKIQDFWSGERIIDITASGSGILFSKHNGLIYIVTNNHVIRGTQNLKVLLFTNQAVDAKLVGTDAATDLAVISIKDDNKLSTAKLGNSDNIMIGEPAIAIGCPGIPRTDMKNNTMTITAGLISAINRRFEDVGQQISSFIQTDAAINPGNSGGPLVNADGEIIGINTLKIVAEGYEGLGFSIPINTVKQVVSQLIAKGRVVRGYLGLKLYEKKTLEQYGFTDIIDQGVLVNSVESGTPAYKAGIHKGDIIQKINEKEINSATDILAITSALPIGTTIVVKIKRGEKNMNLKLILEEPQKDTIPDKKTNDDNNDND